MSTMNDLQQLIVEYQSFQGAYNSASFALQNVIKTGSDLYADAKFTQLFPNSVAAYKAYLVSLQTAINTFLASLPVAPPING